MHAPLTRLAARLAAPHPDGELLARFARHRDEAAFTALVHRHGPTVYGACRRVLGNADDADDADDAFQAVFLVLVNRADSLANRPALGDWLHGVAVRVSLKARTTFARLRKRERRAAELRPESVFDPPPPEPSEWLDRELAALPDRLRQPVVGCLLQERPRAEVAAELGIPEGTLASRLDAARKRLAERLARHRVALAFGGLLVPVPATISAKAVDRATGGAAVVIHQLANEVTRTMIPNKSWLALAAVGMLTAAVGGWLLAAANTPAVSHRPAPPPPAPKEPPEPEWAQKFRKAYELVPGEDVKRVAPPYLPERIDFQLSALYEGAKIDPAVDAENRQRSAENSMFSTVFVEQDGLKLRMRMSLSSAYLADKPELRQGDNLLTVWDAVTCITGLKTPEMVIDPACKEHPLFTAKNKTVHGDFVTRKGAPLAAMVLQLETILRLECNVDVRLTLKEEEQTVFVVGGAFKAKPPAWRPKGELDVYAEEQALNKEYDHFNFGPGRKVVPNVKSSRYSGSPVELVRFVGGRVQTRMVWDAPLPTEPKLSWHSHAVKNPTADEEAADRDPDKVLKVVAEQTGLTFKKEKRKVAVLYLSAPPK